MTDEGKYQEHLTFHLALGEVFLLNVVQLRYSVVRRHGCKYEIGLLFPRYYGNTVRPALCSGTISSCVFATWIAPAIQLGGEVGRRHDD